MGSVKFSKTVPYLQSALRIAAAFLFFTHGTQKLFAFPGGSRATLVSLLGAAGIIETTGGALLCLGLFTRPVGSSSQARWPMRTSPSISGAARGRS